MKSSDTFRALTFFAVCALVIPAKAEEADDLEQLRKHAVALVNEARRVEGLTCESACKSDPLGWVMII